MTAVTLYSDQSALVGKLAASMARTKSPLLQSATGSGKTRMAAHMIDRARLKGNRAGFIVPRKTLFAQTAETFDGFDIPFGCIAAGYKPSPFEKVQLISAGTLSRRLDKAPKLDVVFIDECHFGGTELDRIINHYKDAGSWVVGLSATPMKTNGQGMGEWYNELIEGPSVKWLMENQRLSKYRLFAPDTPDLSALRITNGEYVQKDVDGYMTSDETGKKLVGNAANHYKKNSMGKLNVSFCTSIKHAEITAGIFNERGIPSVAVSGKTDKNELKRIIKAYAKREILNICNAQLLAFGFDLSQASGIDVTIESMNDLAPSNSLPWQLQKWGRALRMKSDAAILNDHAGNVGRHGMPDSDREWTLEAKKKRGGSSEKTEPTRQCTECFFCHRPSPECPNCGHVYPVIGRQVEEVDGELVEVTDVATMSIPQQVGIIARKDGLKGLQEYAKANGYKPSWAYQQMKFRGLRA